MKRESTFFGVHFDFHALRGQTVGEDFHPETVAKMLDEVKPDFAQCDTKGHEGLSSYETAIGTPADEIKEDVVGMWRSLTRERGIPLYAHHSGLYDRRAASLHPDWAVKNENGEISEDYMSVFSPYADEILIPQLKELCEKYGFDGMWIDGDCWAAEVDYSDYAVKAYRDARGKEPPKKNEEGYEDFYIFCQRAFEDYVAKYINEVKAEYPDVEITSNWAYSAYMPSPIKAPIDFISGDYDSTNSVLSARYHGRCIAARNITWDLMAWGQNAHPSSWMATNRNTKELSQYCQEAAQIVALGGGFQFFNIMYGYGGTVQDWAIPMWKKVAEFCRERKDQCFRAKQVPQVAVIYPYERPHTEDERLFPHWNYEGARTVRGWIDALQDIQVSSSVIYEYQLPTASLSQYPVIVLPSALSMNEESIEALREYVKNGGRLIVEPTACNYLSDVCGIKIDGHSEDSSLFIDSRGELFAITAKYPSVKCDNARVSTYLYERNYYDGNPLPASYISEYGKGKAISLCFPLGEIYRNNITTRIRNYVKDALASLDFVPMAEIEGSSYIEVALMEKNGALMINLLNTAGAHNSEGVRSYSEIPALGPVRIKLHTDKKPKKVYAEPEHKRLRASYKNGVAELTLDRLDIHTVITVE